MKFDTPAGSNPIDQGKVVGQAPPRIDGALKTTGAATYAYEQHAAAANQAYGYIVGAPIAKGRIAAYDLAAARAAPGVLSIVTAQNAGKLGVGEFYVAPALAGPDIVHYHQAVAIVVAETFEQARAYAAAPVRLDATYTTPDQSHVMLEPHASVAQWQGGQLTLWTSVQIIKWAKRDLAKMLGVTLERVVVTLGDSQFPEACGSLGQSGANSATSGVYAACVKLREAIAKRQGFDPALTEFSGGEVRSGARSLPLARAALAGDIVGEDTNEFGPAREDVAHQDVIFIDEADPATSPMKAKGVGELGMCGVALAIANAVYNATGVRVRDYPVTLDKLLDRLPAAG